MTGLSRQVPAALQPQVPNSVMPRRLKAITQLRQHWGDAYEIEEAGPRARRRDGSGGWITTTHGLDGLWTLIRADYAKNPVNREEIP